MKTLVGVSGNITMPNDRYIRASNADPPKVPEAGRGAQRQTPTRGKASHTVATPSTQATELPPQGTEFASNDEMFGCSEYPIEADDPDSLGVGATREEEDLYRKESNEYSPEMLAAFQELRVTGEIPFWIEFIRSFRPHTI